MLEPGLSQHFGTVQGSEGVKCHRLEDSVVSFRPNYPPDCRKEGPSFRSFCSVVDNRDRCPQIMDFAVIPNRNGRLEEKETNEDTVAEKVVATRRIP